jgi:hypothetical protein
MKFYILLVLFLIAIGATVIIGCHYHKIAIGTLEELKSDKRVYEAVVVVRAIGKRGYEYYWPYKDKDLKPGIKYRFEKNVLVPIR